MLSIVLLFISTLSYGQLLIEFGVELPEAFTFDPTQFQVDIAQATSLSSPDRISIVDLNLQEFVVNVSFTFLPIQTGVSPSSNSIAVLLRSILKNQSDSRRVELLTRQSITMYRFTGIVEDAVLPLIVFHVFSTRPVSTVVFKFNVSAAVGVVSSRIEIKEYKLLSPSNYSLQFRFTEGDVTSVLLAFQLQSIMFQKRAAVYQMYLSDFNVTFSMYEGLPLLTLSPLTTRPPETTPPSRNFIRWVISGTGVVQAEFLALLSLALEITASRIINMVKNVTIPTSTTNMTWEFSDDEGNSMFSKENLTLTLQRLLYERDDPPYLNFLSGYNVLYEFYGDAVVPLTAPPPVLNPLISLSVKYTGTSLNINVFRENTCLALGIPSTRFVILGLKSESATKIANVSFQFNGPTQTSPQLPLQLATSLMYLFFLKTDDKYVQYLSQYELVAEQWGGLPEPTAASEVGVPIITFEVELTTVIANETNSTTSVLILPLNLSQFASDICSSVNLTKFRFQLVSNTTSLGDATTAPLTRIQFKFLSSLSSNRTPETITRDLQLVFALEEQPFKKYLEKYAILTMDFDYMAPMTTGAPPPPTQTRNPYLPQQPYISPPYGTIIRSSASMRNGTAGDLGGESSSSVLYAVVFGVLGGVLFIGGALLAIRFINRDKGVKSTRYGANL